MTAPSRKAISRFDIAPSILLTPMPKSIRNLLITVATAERAENFRSTFKRGEAERQE